MNTFASSPYPFTGGIAGPGGFMYCSGKFITACLLAGRRVSVTADDFIKAMRQSVPQKSAALDGVHIEISVECSGAMKEDLVSV
jgi:hypothetical protein